RVQSTGGFRRVEGGPTHLTVAGGGIYRPDGQLLLANVDPPPRPGGTGPRAGASGSGKSTLIRAIAGIWPFGQGEIRLPRDARVLVLPPRRYPPIGTPREGV